MSSVFLDILQQKPTHRPAVWLMRQAGRSLKAYQELKQRYSFRQLMENAELAATVTLQPVAYHGVDAAILFSDILIVVEALGIPVSYETQKPRITLPLASAPHKIQTVLQPQNWNFSPFAFSTSAIHIVKKSSKIPLIGFCGGPLTLLCYLYEGMGGSFPRTKSFIYTHEQTAEALLQAITDISIVYAKQQIEAGVDAFQLFETWAGAIPGALYEKLVLPQVVRFANAVNGYKNTPLIFYPRLYSAMLKSLPAKRFSAVGIDQFTPLTFAHNALPQTVLQGNLDPYLPLAIGGRKLEKKIEVELRFFKQHPAWIVNLGHGVLPHTPQENIRALVETVKNFKGA